MGLDLKEDKKKLKRFLEIQHYPMIVESYAAKALPLVTDTLPVSRWNKA